MRPRTIEQGLELTGLSGLDLAVAPGELVALIGPSGSGKTTLLRAISGLDPMLAGTVRIDGRDQTGVPAERRPLAMMVETPVLFPQLTVAENIAFALDRDLAARAAADALDTALTSLDLQVLAEHYPERLSAGQRQRVALARALVRRPRVLLFDEPLAHVDPVARTGLRREILRTHHRIGCASLLVTHDGHEALAIADRIAVMRDGRIVQVAPPRELYARPADTWVATRLGAPNFLTARIEAVQDGPDGHRVRVRVLGREHDVPAAGELTDVGETCVVTGHPHAVTATPAPPSTGLDPRRGTVLSAGFGGDHVDYDIETDAGTLVVRRPLGPAEEPWPAGTAVEVDLVADAVWAVAR